MSSSPKPTPKPSRTCCSKAQGRRGSVRGGAPRHQRVARRLRDRRRHRGGPFRAIVARRGSPLLLGVGEDGMYAASDTAALLQVTRKDRLSGRRRSRRTAPRQLRVIRSDGSPVERPVHVSSPVGRCGRARQVPPLHAEGNLRAAAGAGQHPGDDRRRRLDQPADLRRACKATASPRPAACWCWPAAPATTPRWWRATGSSRSPASPAVEIASEYRYRENRCPTPTPWSSSSRNPGETADTLAALKHAKSLGMEQHPGDLQRARIRHRARSRAALHHPCRPRDRCRLHQGLYHPAGRTRAADAGARETARPAARCEESATHLAALRHLPVAVARCWSSSRRSSNGHRNSRQAARTLPRPRPPFGRSPWKARSSSRKSPISTPRAMPPANSGTARWPWWTRTCP